MRGVCKVVRYKDSCAGRSARLLGHALNPSRSVLVNWTGKELTDSRKTVLNEHTSTDKLLQLERLKLGDVPVPDFSPRLVEGWAGRTKYHTRGSDFQPQAPGVRRDPRYDFWVKMYPSTREFRMHVVRKPGEPKGHPGSYEVFRTGEKIRGEGAARGVEWEGFPIRSRDFGWTLKYCRTGTRPNGLSKFVTASKWAVSCLHWDFGAVDLIQLSDGKPMVLECNSCPSLRDEYTLGAYVAKINALMEE